MININFSCSKHITENYKSFNGTLEDLSEVVKSDLNYTPFVFENGYRKESNSILNLCNSIMLDFDDGLAVDKAMTIFDNYYYLIATTKSHQKDKNGKICDRFRIIFPLSKSIDLTIEEYKSIMSLLVIKYGNDKSCKDIARFYYGYKNSEVFINFNGKDFLNIDSLKKEAILYFKLKKELEEPKQQNIIKNYNYTTNSNLCENKRDWFYKYSHTQYMLDYFKFNTRFSAGGRNTYLFSVARHFQEEGCDPDFIKYELEWINSQGDGISEREIQQTIYRSLKI